MLKSTNVRPARQTMCDVRGVSYRVRSIKTFAFTVYRVDGQWIEPTNAKHERNLRALAVPSVHVDTVHVNLTRANRGSNLITREVTGSEYDDVTDYLGEAGMVGATSYRDRRGVRSTVHLTDTRSR